MTSNLGARSEVPPPPAAGQIHSDCALEEIKSDTHFVFIDSPAASWKALYNIYKLRICDFYNLHTFPLAQQLVIPLDLTNQLFGS